jgi:hypothetical protein
LIRSLRYGSPAFIIPGAQKCGTTALAVYLGGHPRLRLATTKEPDFFLRDERYRRGGADYRKLFPRRRPPGGELFFEASVGYSFNPAVPKRMAAFDPELRFVLMVREPAGRAHSAWNMYRTLVSVPSERSRFEEWLEGHNPPDRAAGLAMLERSRAPSFQEAIDAELEAFARNGPAWTLPALVAGGLYAAQLERFLAHFPRDRFLVLEDRELAERPAETLNRVLAFLGLDPHDWGDDFPRVLEGTYDEAADDATLARLRDFYADPNARFFELTGRSFDW